MRFAHLFATLATAATSFVAAAPVASPNGTASAQSTLDAISGINSQLDPLVDEFTFLTHSGSQDVDFFEINSVAAQITALVVTVRTDSTFTNGVTIYAAAEEAQPIISLVKHTVIITSNAEVLTYGSTAAVVGNLINEVSHTMNSLMAVIDPQLKEALSSDFAAINNACKKIGSDSIVPQ